MMYKLGFGHRLIETSRMTYNIHRIIHTPVSPVYASPGSIKLRGICLERRGDAIIHDHAINAAFLSHRGLVIIHF